jgi:hypothetical protein
MANRVATILGVLFLLIGVLGFILPHAMGAHLSQYHNIIHLVSGAVSLWLGLKGSSAAARNFCISFGSVYLLLGLVGFFRGEGADRILAVIPGRLELGTVDHVIHVLFGAAYLIAGFMTKAAVDRRERG